jgi:hypothetical protein
VKCREYPGGHWLRRLRIFPGRVKVKLEAVFDILL